MELRIAWRNIWRNKKRTMITVTSVMLAVILAVFVRSLQEGSYAKMIENAAGQFTGYVQIHQKEYWDDQSLDNGMEVNDSLLGVIKSIPQIKGVNMRLESFALASNEKNTKGVLVMGINTVSEDSMLNLSSKMITGHYLNPNDNSILLGSKLASFLNISTGDTLVMLGQGYWGQSAIGAYPVKGIVKMPSAEIDRQIVFMPLKLAQSFYSFPNGITSIVVKFNDATLTKSITTKLNNKLKNSDYRAIPWQKMTPELVQEIQSDRSGGIFMIAVLYMIIAFGVFGTTLMMTEERKKEFAVLVAIGTQKTRLMLISLYENILINGLAILMGVLISVPLVYYYSAHPLRMTGDAAASMENLGIEPIMPTTLSADIFINQIIVILIIVGIATLYPLISLGKMNLIKSLRR